MARIDSDFSADTNSGPESGQLWAQFHDRLRRFIAHRVSDPDDAEDLLQEVFLRLHRNVEGLGSGANVRAWLYRVTRNAVVDYYRDRARVRARERPAGDPGQAEAEGREAGWTDASPWGEAPGSDGEPVRAAERALARCMEPLLATLPPDYRQALVWTELEGLTQAEAAARAGISLSGMKSRVQRGRRKLRAELLNCCAVELDVRGQVREVQGPACGDCG